MIERRVPPRRGPAPQRYAKDSTSASPAAPARVVKSMPVSLEAASSSPSGKRRASSRAMAPSAVAQRAISVAIKTNVSMLLWGMRSLGSEV